MKKLLKVIQNNIILCPWDPSGGPLLEEARVKVPPGPMLIWL